MTDKPISPLRQRMIEDMTARHERGIRSPNQRQRQAKTNSCSGHGPAIQSPYPAQARSTFASRPKPPTDCDPQIPIDRASGASALS